MLWLLDLLIRLNVEQPNIVYGVLFLEYLPSKGPSEAVALLRGARCTSSSQCQMEHEKKDLLRSSETSALV